MAIMDTAEVAARNYAAFHDQLADEAQMAALEGSAPLTRRVLDYRAKVALRAMLAELQHPDSPDRPYRLCCTACTAFLTRNHR